MVSDLIGKLQKKAEDNGVGQAKEALGKTDKILDGGPKRSPAEIASVEGQFVAGDDLSTPGGDAPSASSSPVEKGSGAPTKDAMLRLGKKIEFIHCGIVHYDLARNFDHTDPIDDLQTIDTSTIVGSRAIMFRAALEREAVLLGALVTGTQMAFKAEAPDVGKLHEKDKDGNEARPDMAQGALSKALQIGGDLVGGKSSGAAQTASHTDLSPFLDKLNTLWTPLIASPIQYDALHDAGIQLHAVRVSLRQYVRGQLDVKEKGPDGSKKGLLSDLPVIGAIPIPGPIGDVIGFMQKVTTKLGDVKTQMVFELMLAMQPAMDKACHDATIDSIRKKTSPIYPVWYAPPPPTGVQTGPISWIPPPPDGSTPDDKIAKYDPGDVLGGDLGVVPGVGNVNQGVKDAANKYYNKPINDAAAAPMEIIDFLSRKVDPPAPGSAWIADVFAVADTPDRTPGPLAGGKALGNAAFKAFGQAMGNSETVPDFLQGFVQTMVTEVFEICSEFLRAVYEKLCGLKPEDVVSTKELLKAGEDHILLSLVDLALQKSGLDEMIKKLHFTLPPLPFSPPGVTLPQNKDISVLPILAELKRVMTDKLGKFLDPIVKFVMSGLAERLNAQRSWASPMAMTMEAHVAQLPGEMTQMFIGLFGPLWGFLNDTIMGAVNNAVGKVLGPAGSALGVVQKDLGKVSGVIADAERKANQAKAYAQKVEEKVGAFLDKLHDIHADLGPDGGKNLGELAGAANALGSAVGTNPFSKGGAEPPKVNAATADSVFQPAGRTTSGTGAKVDEAMLAKVKPFNKMPPVAGSADADAGADQTGGK